MSDKCNVQTKQVYISTINPSKCAAYNKCLATLGDCRAVKVAHEVRAAEFAHHDDFNLKVL
jgi:hypothetical protein